MKRNRRGRKRKMGRRYASGDIKRQAETPLMVAKLMPHRKTFGEAASNALAESAFGRLFLRREISQSQHNAGCMYRAKVLAYQAVIGGPKRLTNGNGRGMECSFDCWGDMCICARRKEAYHEMLAALLSVEWQALYNCIILDIEVIGRELGHMLCALEALVKLFRLTDDRKSDLGNAQSRIVA